MISAVKNTNHTTSKKTNNKNINPKKRQIESKKNGKEALILLAGAAATAAIAGIAYAIKKGKTAPVNAIIPPKKPSIPPSGGNLPPVDSQTPPVDIQMSIEKFRQNQNGSFKKGVAFYNGEKYTGKITTNNDSNNVVLEYIDGILSQSSKNVDEKGAIAYDGFIKKYTFDEQGALESLERIDTNMSPAYTLHSRKYSKKDGIFVEKWYIDKDAKIPQPETDSQYTELDCDDRLLYAMDRAGMPLDEQTVRSIECRSDGSRKYTFLNFKNSHKLVRTTEEYDKLRRKIDAKDKPIITIKFENKY